MSWEEDFVTAKKMLSKGLFHAANSIYRELTKHAQEQLDMNKLGEMFDDLGTIYLFKIPDYKKAVNYFRRAMESTNEKDERVKYTIHLGTAYRKMSEFDTWSRYLTSLTEDLDGVSNSTQGLLYANLSAIHGINGFYDQAIHNIDRSLEAYSNISSSPKEVLANNKGLAYLELGMYDQAEFHLKQALELSQNDLVEPLSELGRLYLLQGRIVESIQYAERALDIIWSSIIEYNKDELALLCNLLASIAIQVSERELAIRLAEKAQVFFGQLGMWRQWQNIDFQLERWQNEIHKPYSFKNQRFISLDKIRHFLQSLEALNSQELIHKKLSQLLDVRVYYVQLFSRELNLSKQDQEDLVLASRFADYGLTALENEVIMNPMRSEIAFNQYKQHPWLSVQMVKALNVSDRITEIIVAHHEHYDGSGYPKGKKGKEINHLSRILHLVDTYAQGIVMEAKSHFELMDDIIAQKGTFFDPMLVDAFVEMHEVKMEA